MAHPFAAANANANAQVCILIQLQTTTDRKGTQKRPNIVSKMPNMKLLISFFLFGILTAYFYQESIDMTGIVKAYFYEGSVDTTADIPPEDYCVDKDSECTTWASLGECIDNKSFMLKTCCKSCAGAGVVSETTDDVEEDEDDCVNKDKECPNWASIGECEANESFMLKTCCKSCLGGDSYE